MKILPYKLASKSAKLLAKHLRCKRIRPNTNTYRHASGRLVVNWGCENQRSTIPIKDYLNVPAAVRLASNKLSCFLRLYLRGVPTLDWTESRSSAQHSLDGMTAHSIYCRHELSGNSGAGIEVIKFGGEVPDAPLYTFGMDHWSEWRIHMAKKPNGEIRPILVQQKVLRDTQGSEGDGVDVRNHTGNFIFKRNNLCPPDYYRMQEVAADTITALGLHFGAIDIAYHKGQWKVIEVNTAPGLAGTTYEKYVEYFNEYNKEQG